jgi:hypothetical protein
VSRYAETHAETAKLARVLGLAGPEPLAYLRRVPADELRDYREAVTGLLFEQDAELLRRAADAARLLPPRVIARIAERALGPMLCARVTGLLEPQLAAEVSRYLSIEFLAQLAAELDPRRCADVVVSTPGQRVLEIALAMARRGEHVAMGRFVAHLDGTTLAACVRQLTDEDLLRVSFVLEGKGRIAEIAAFAGPERICRMLGHADAMGLAEEARDLIEHLDVRSRERFIRRVRS